MRSRNSATDNKTRKALEAKSKVPECDAVRCPKLDTVVEGVLKKVALDEDREVQNLAKDADFPQSAPCLFGQGIEQKKSRPGSCGCSSNVQEDYHCRVQTEDLFFEGAPPRAPLNQAGMGGADTRHKTTISLTIKIKEVPVQEGPSQGHPPRLGIVINNTPNNPQKSDIVSVAINTYI